jgi:phage terminase large subunit GpA-like protein
MLWDDEKRIVRQPPAMTVSEWSAKNLIVQDGPFKGTSLRLDWAPYLIKIMDVFGLDEVEEVCVCGAPQTGKTLAMYSCLGYSVDRRQGTKMLAMPDDKTLARVSADKLRPLLNGSPALAGLIGKILSGYIQLKDGSNLFLSSAQAPAQRASITVRDLFLDEEDLYAAIAGRGDPVSDFLERTRSYSFDRKIMRVSKPVGDARSSIWQAVTKKVDVTYAYEVPCPHCGELQFFQEAYLTAAETKGARPDENEIIRLGLGRYKCPGCGGLWLDADRDQAVARGSWQPCLVADSAEAGAFSFHRGKEVRNPKKVGFHLPAILSRAVSLSELAARAKLAAVSDNEEFKQTQANGDWARPYLAVVVKPDEAAILNRREMALPARTVPYGAIALTAGIDTQKFGFYYLVLAWMPSMAVYIIDYGRLIDFAEVYRLVYDRVYPVLNSEGELTGEVMDLWRSAIDTGGTAGEGVYSRTEEVYEFVRQNGTNRLFAVKGASREISPAVRWTVLDRMPGRQTPIEGGLMLYTIDTGKIKSAVFKALMEEMSTRPVRLYGTDPERASQEGLHDELILHLTAEEQVRTARGQLVWVPKRKANHYLDCLMMARACGDVSWTPSIHHYLMELQAQQEAAAYQQRIQSSAERKKKRERPRAW